MFSFCFFANNAFATSFDCSGDIKRVEHIICSDKLLSKEDDKLSSLYGEAIRISTNKDSLKHSQREWLRTSRDKCKDSKCILRSYQERIQFLQGIIVSISPDPLSDIEGTYLMLSRNCTSVGAPDEQGEWPDCGPKVVDCLSIKRLSAKSARVSVVTFYTNYHTCSARGIATVEEPGKLVIKKEDIDADVNDSDFEIDFFSDIISVDGPRVLCGARAYWETSFLKSDRVTKNALNCEEDQNLYKYLPE